MIVGGRHGRERGGQLEHVLDVETARAPTAADLRGDLLERGLAEPVGIGGGRQIDQRLDAASLRFDVDPHPMALVAALLAVVEHGQDLVVVAGLDPIHGAPADLVVGPGQEGDDPTWGSGDAAMVGRTLPESAPVAVHEPGQALGVRERGPPNQRAVAEDPHRHFGHAGLPYEIVGEIASETDYTPGMPRPRGLSFELPGRTLGLMLVTIALVAGCRERKPVVTQPDDDAPVATVVEIDALAMCNAGCERLTRCAPDLAAEAGSSPDEVVGRLASECSPACLSFASPSPTSPSAGLRLEHARDAAFALEDCLDLDSCNAFWGCVGTEDVRPWLAAVAPVGERTCANLCGQASSCAIAQVCDESNKDASKRGPIGGLGVGDQSACVADDVLRDELDETCLLQCASTPDDSQARRELIGCLDHVSCGGLLSCLDSWADTAYESAGGPTPGISPTCDGFCTRAIDCGARAEGVELTPAELAQLREVMTSTWVECAVQCEKDLASGEAQQQVFETCTAAADCELFLTCAESA